VKKKVRSWRSVEARLVEDGSTLRIRLRRVEVVDALRSELATLLTQLETDNAADDHHYSAAAAGLHTEAVKFHRGTNTTGEVRADIAWSDTALKAQAGELWAAGGSRTRDVVVDVDLVEVTTRSDSAASAGGAACRVIPERYYWPRLLVRVLRGT